MADVAHPSAVPAVAEPFFLEFNATVKFHVVTPPEQLRQAGLDELGRK